MKKLILPLVVIFITMSSFSKDVYETEPDLADCWAVTVALFEDSRFVIGEERASSMALGYYEDCSNGEFEDQE